MMLFFLYPHVSIVFILISLLNCSSSFTSSRVYQFSSVQYSCSVVSNSLRPHESQHARPPCHHQLPEFTETHVHRVSDAIQPFHPLLSPSPPAPNPSQHQSLFQLYLNGIGFPHRYNSCSRDFYSCDLAFREDLHLEKLHLVASAKVLFWVPWFR